MARKSRTITDVVNELMASLPEVEAFSSHGQPTYRVRGRSFAIYAINHHGDGRVALHLLAPKGSQTRLTEMNEDAYFVPPYSGSKGWLGVGLDRGLAWDVIADHVRDAYELAAPTELVGSLNRNFRVKPPTRKFRPEEVDPFLGKYARRFAERLDKFCITLPETVTATQFGCPVWKAGKKTFAGLHFHSSRLALTIWVGKSQQSKLVRDPRFTISAYTGVHGWIDFDVESDPDWADVEQLVLDSYRHFALKRMLQALD